MSLEIKNLRKTFGETVAVDSLSVTVQQGQVLGLLGRNGAGKTTTIKMLLGLLEPNQGTITWDNKPIHKSNVSIGYLPEERGLHLKAKIVDQLRFFGELEGMTRSQCNEAIDYWFKRLDIEEYRGKKASDLSKGNQQKIQLIAALIHDPQLIILDEPFSGLDPVNADVFAKIIEEQVQKGKTIIMSSHRMESVEAFCDYICILKQGQVVVEGVLTEVKESYGYQHLILPLREDVTNGLASLGLNYEARMNECYVKVANGEEALTHLQALSQKGVPIRNFKVLEPTLHDIFVERAR
ncbi:MAG: ABC transporter ATP-binding protein [Bacillaceae bacterium]